jgi:hypothetical protein
VKSDEAKTLCEQLIFAETEDDVVALLTAAGYWNDPNCWRYYGDSELNWSQAGGQQGRADFALNEKAINAIDSVLTLKCLQDGIDPEGSGAPQSIREAVARFIEKGNPKLSAAGGRVEDWPQAFRTQVAENISVFTTEGQGSKRGTKPNVNIADLGEGHTPEAFPHTFVSLGRRNKAMVPFVQGKFCQGGSGAIRHCGERKLQLVVSRRNPALLASLGVPAGYPKHDTDDHWGFTVVRREQADAKSRVPALTYLAPLGATAHPRKGGVLRFLADEMPLFPKGDVAYRRSVPAGTLIKLYAYQLKSTGNILRRDGLLYKLDLLLPDPALPIRMHECRKRAHGEGEKGVSTQETTMSGLFARLQKSENLEDAPPITMPITVRGKQVIARVFAFKAGKGETYRNNEGVIFTVNGQAHADIKASIFTRKRVGLQRLYKDLLVVVDCSALDANERDDLFMSSRDRVAEESPLFTELERSLEDALHDHPGLRELKNRRAQEDLAQQLGDNKPLEAVLKRVFKNSPALAKLFGKGERLSNPFKQEKKQTDEKPPKLHTHPTFFHFAGRVADEPLIRAAHVDQKCRLTFVTDAEDEYFTRKYDPGKLTFSQTGDEGSTLVQTYIGPNLVQGRASLSFDLPSTAKPGDVLTYQVVVTDDVTGRVFINTVTLKVAPAQQAKPTKPGKGPQPPGPTPGQDVAGEGGIHLPSVLRLKKSDPKWAQHFTDDNDCLDVINDGSDGEPLYRFYLNEDNRALQTELKASKGSVEVHLKQFEVGAVLVGLSLLHAGDTMPKPVGDDGESKGEEEGVLKRIQQTTRAIAPILLPMIKTLGELTEDDLEGEAAANEAA